MRRLIVAIVLAATSVPLMAQPCLACSCVPPPRNQEEREEWAKDARAVFTGKVWKVKGEYNTNHSNVRVRFFVEDAYKGTDKHRVTVKTPNNGAACGYYFEEGKRYTVFAYDKGPKAFKTSLCSGNKHGRINPDRWGL